MRFLTSALLAPHVMVAGLSIAFMDANWALSAWSNRAIDAYEWAGLGSLFAGLAVVTALLVMLWLAARRWKR